MEIRYFLARPLLEEEVCRLANNRKNFLFDAEKYLIPICYKQTIYLAKPLSRFPMALEVWELHVQHVISLLKQQFGILTDHAPILLACEAQQVVLLESLDSFVNIS